MRVRFGVYPPKREPSIRKPTSATGCGFVDYHAECVRYVGDWRSWCVFDGARWQRDADGIIVERLAKQTVQQMAADAIAKLKHATELAEADPDDERVKAMIAEAKKLHGWAKSSHDMRRLRAMIAAAKSDLRIYVPCGSDVFDRRADLLNVRNGTIDLRAGTLRPHQADDMLTHLVPHAFDPTASCDQYDEFLGSLFPSAPTIAEYMHRLGGYVLTGEVTEQVLHIAVGGGSNGKSLLLELWRFALGGDLTYSIPHELLVDDRGNAHPTERAGFRGCRLAIAAETAEDAPLREAMVKALTGSDRLSARYCGRDRFEFDPTHKAIFCTNYLPRIKGTDAGIWRRLRPIPFERRFWTEADKLREPNETFRDEDRADPHLLATLRASVAGVLRAMVDAARLYYRDGLPVPPELAKVAAAYRADEDLLGQFVSQKIRADPQGRVPLGDLLRAYQDWAKAEAFDKPIGRRTFSRYFRARFTHNKASVERFHVRVLSPWESDSAA